MASGCNKRQETLPKCNLHGMNYYSMSYEIAKDSITISINRTVQEKNTDMANFQEKEDEIESCSSIIELEPNESDADSLTLSFPVPDATSTSRVINEPKLLMTCPTTLPGEFSHISPVTSSSSISGTQQSTQFPCAAFSAEGSSSDYYLKNSFFIEKRNRKTCITDAKWMPNKYLIAIAEKSNPRCIMYSKDGEKKGQVRLSGEPDSIAVITCVNNNLIGISLIFEQKVCILDNNKMQVVKAIIVHDDCKGLVCFDNLLIANCANDGLIYIAKSSKIVKVNEYIKGDLYCHVDTQGNLYSAKMNTNNIHVNNLINNKRYTYYLKNLIDPTGLTTDRDNNLFVACMEMDMIFVKHSLHSPANTVLDRPDGIDGPSSIDYNQENDELLVVNNHCSSIFIFKKK